MTREVHPKEPHEFRMPQLSIDEDPPSGRKGKFGKYIEGRQGNKPPPDHREVRFNGRPPDRPEYPCDQGDTGHDQPDIRELPQHLSSMHLSRLLDSMATSP